MKWSEVTESLKYRRTAFQTFKPSAISHHQNNTPLLSAFLNLVATKCWPPLKLLWASSIYTQLQSAGCCFWPSSTEISTHLGRLVRLLSANPGSRAVPFPKRRQVTVVNTETSSRPFQISLIKEVSFTSLQVWKSLCRVKFQVNCQLSTAADAQLTAVQCLPMLHHAVPCSTFQCLRGHSGTMNKVTKVGDCASHITTVPLTLDWYWHHVIMHALVWESGQGLNIMKT